MSRVAVGDRIVYSKTKFSPLPAAQGASVYSASDKGENYTYLVDKYWVVADVLENDAPEWRRLAEGNLNHVQTG